MLKGITTYVRTKVMNTTITQKREKREAEGRTDIDREDKKNSITIFTSDIGANCCVKPLLYKNRYTFNIKVGHSNGFFIWVIYI